MNCVQAALIQYKKDLVIFELFSYLIYIFLSAVKSYRFQAHKFQAIQFQSLVHARPFFDTLLALSERTSILVMTVLA